MKAMVTRKAQAPASPGRPDLASNPGGAVVLLPGQVAGQWSSSQTGSSTETMLLKSYDGNNQG